MHVICRKQNINLTREIKQYALRILITVKAFFWVFHILASYLSSPLSKLIEIKSTSGKPENLRGRLPDTVD